MESPLVIKEVRAFVTDDGKLHESQEAAEAYDLSRAIGRLIDLRPDAWRAAVEHPSSLQGYSWDASPIAKSILHLAALIEKNR